MQEVPAVLLVVISVCCFCGVRSDIIPDFLQEDFHNIYKNIAIEAKEITDAEITPDEITYFLWTKSDPETHTQIHFDNPEPLGKTDVTIVFFIHGWTESRQAAWFEPLRKTFLSKDDEYYVVEVDWSGLALRPYTISSWITRDIGGLLGELLVALHQNYSVPLKNILLVGHSLGGQISGFAGKKVQQTIGQKLPRIVALDPAGPLFETRPEEERLNKNDAEVVQVLHTDGDKFGFKEACGTIDFFPNGGNAQPGCDKIDLLDVTSVAEPVTCDHSRGWSYFIEATANPEEFLATKCDGWEQFQSGQCEQIHVAVGDLKTEEAGNFYLITNHEKPFYKKSGTSEEEEWSWWWWWCWWF